MKGKNTATPKTSREVAKDAKAREGKAKGKDSGWEGVWWAVEDLFGSREAAKGAKKSKGNGKG